MGISIKRINVPAGTLRAASMKKLAGEVFQYQYFDGVTLFCPPGDVPFYGTALSLMLKNFHRPIVFFTRESQASEAEAWAALGVNGVFAMGDDGFDLACRTTYTAEKGLHSPHYPQVGHWTVRRSILTNLLPKEEDDPFLMCDAMNDNILVFYPGDDLLSRPELETISGIHISISKEEDLQWLLVEQMPALTLMRRKGVPVVVTGLPPQLDIPMRRRQLLLSGVVSAGDMTREAAMVKLMWTLARTGSQNGVKLYFSLSFAGERNNSL